MTTTTRRTVLTGAAAATALTAAAGTAIAQTPNSAPNTAPSAAPTTAADIDTFVTISAVLTGIAADKLAPEVDPIKIKLQYFELAKNEAAFGTVVQIYNDNKKQPAPMIAAAILRDKDAATLARSIMLAWYLGCWYSPAALRSGSPIPDKVVSSAAYTQGWVWRIAQAHPMGYSELRFGYWGQTPPDLSVFVEA